MDWDVSVATWALPPEEALPRVSEENFDPGTVGFVSSMLKSESFQRTCMPNTKSSASVAIHLLYDDSVPVRHV